jgi:hypothetical protein
MLKAVVKRDGTVGDVTVKKLFTRNWTKRQSRR